jgi:hypothetical protein
MAPLLAQVAPTTGNAAPRWTAADDTSVKAKEHLEQSYRAEDPEKDPLTYTIEGLPMGAKAEERDGAVVVDWTPGDGDVGTYELTLKVADSHGLTAEKKVKLTVEEDVNNFVMPGVEYALYVPKDEPPPGEGKIGIFQGVRVEFCIWCYVHRSDKRGPAIGKTYVAFDLLGSSEKTSSALFNAVVGFNLSLEKNPSRRFLIPFFGSELGIWYQKVTETLGMATPYAGLHLWSSGNLDITLKGGALLPFSSHRLDQLIGLRAGLGFNLAFW